MTSTEPVTASLPTEVRRALQRVAEDTGVSFSSVVDDALDAWLRARLVDAWLEEHRAEHGAFDEEELRQLAADAGVPHLPPEPRGPLREAGARRRSPHRHRSR